MSLKSMSSAPEAKSRNGDLLFALFSQRAAPGLGKHIKVILVVTWQRGEGSTHSVWSHIWGAAEKWQKKVDKTGLNFNETRLIKC